MNDSIVDIEHLEFAYGNTLALRHIDLRIQRGSTLGVIGPNGAGKSTLIKLLLGLLEPTRGRILVDTMPPRRAVARGDVIGYLPQNPASPGNFPISVRQLVRLGLAGKTGMLQSYARADLEFVEELIHRVGIDDLANAPVGSLSGGQLQRTLIARALAPRPKLLLLDEPTTGVDHLGQRRFIEFAESLKDDFGLTIVLVSHDLRTVSAIADRIACLNISLHYHDVPARMPQEIATRLFHCDLEAMGLGGERHEGCCAEHAHFPASETDTVAK
jgi:zinc transport system ATP-binding protein